MYVRTSNDLGLGWGIAMPTKWPQSAVRSQFTSKVVVYTDSDGKVQSTKYAIYVPPAWRDPQQLDLLVFFHGLLHVCDQYHKNDPDRLIKKFRLDVQVNSDSQLALVAPIILWNNRDRSTGTIAAAWSAANLNAFVEEVFDQIGKASNVRPKLGRLILVGHSAAYEIMTPLAEQFIAGAAGTTKGALAKLERVVAMDTTYRTKDAEALEQWARSFGRVVFNLVQSNSDSSVPVWQNWDRTRKNKTGFGVPKNLRIFHEVRFGHCDLPSNFLTTYNYSFPD
jgi:hypothetical protein